jgi:DNA ligase-1
MNFKPLLASPADLDKLDLTDMLLSPKLDGIRAIVIDGVVMSRSLKPIPNQHVQKLFAHLEYYDGELICGDPTSPTCYRDTNSAVMKRDGEPDVTFHAFDHIQYPDHEYSNRVWRLEESGPVKVVAQHPLTEEFNLEFWETYYLEKGFEGVMLRKCTGQNSLYKFGRATAKSHTLLKVKRFVDNEYEVIGYDERMHNGNVATKDELGHTTRSSHRENLVGRGDLGALTCKTADGIVFNVGTGFTDDDRAKLWAVRDTLGGKIAKVKSFLVGVKDAPRFPVFLGLRDPMDL